MKDDTVAINVLLNAKVKNVWQAWTEPDMMIRWFGSDPMGTGLNASVDLHPGGRFQVRFANADQTEYTCFGKYVEIEVDSKLTFTWEWKNEPGVESFVTIHFQEENGKTRMHFEHANLDKASGHHYDKGWISTFLKLEKLLTSQ